MDADWPQEAATNERGDDRPTLRLPNGEVFVVAGRRRRFLASVIDLLAVFVAVATVETLVGIRVFPSRELTTPQLLERWAIGLPVVLGVIVLTMIRTDGETPGKALLRLRVARVSGRAIDLRFAIWREVGTKWLVFGWPVLLPEPWRLLAMAGLIDLIWIVGPKRRALHDEIAPSRVVRS